MEPRELPQEQSSGPRIVTINLEEKSQSSTDPHECPEVQVNPGDTVNWESNQIRDDEKAEILFTGGKHPFKKSPSGLKNNIVIEVDQGRYSYTVREGDTVLGCGNIKTPCDPPGRNQGGSGTSGTP